MKLITIISAACIIFYGNTGKADDTMTCPKAIGEFDSSWSQWRKGLCAVGHSLDFKECSNCDTVPAAIICMKSFTSDPKSFLKTFCESVR